MRSLGVKETWRRSTPALLGEMKLKLEEDDSALHRVAEVHQVARKKLCGSHYQKDSENEQDVDQSQLKNA